MELEPKNLGIPLYKRDKSKLWFALASVALAFLYRKPSQPLDIALTATIGGLTIWLAIGPGLVGLKAHRSPLVQGVVFLLCVIGSTFVLDRGIPWLITLLK